MKKYTINVHFDAVATVVVNAENAEDALDKARELALDEPCEYTSITDACITDVE